MGRDVFQLHDNVKYDHFTDVVSFIGVGGEIRLGGVVGFFGQDVSSTERIIPPREMILIRRCSCLLHSLL
jgi:hypothetical protein